jgi:uncharacterized protein
MMILDGAYEYEWDSANRDKIFNKHGISTSECEEACSEPNHIVKKDPLHSTTEIRYHLLGKTNQGTLLFISFTLRVKRIRIISARPITKPKELHFYEK